MQNPLDVIIHFTNGKSQTIRNVIEIHYRYEGNDMIAFECKDHGQTIPLEMIAEFEAIVIPNETSSN